MGKCVCVKCGHVWQSRAENPVQCPRCKSYKWKDNGIKKEGEE